MRRRRHVVVDARLATAAGHRTYIRNIVPRMAALTPEWRWSLLGERPRLSVEPWVRNLGLPIADVSAPVYGLAEQIRIPMRIPKDADLFWSMHYNIPLAARVPVIATIHDAAHLRLPEYRARPLHHGYARIMFHAALARASAVIFNSEFTRREVMELVGEPRATGTVVHMGIDEAWFEPVRETPALEPPYFVFVGNLKPHKNVQTLLAAFRRIAADVPERLVLAGRTEGLRTRDNAALSEIEAAGTRVVLAGEVSDEQLRAVVASATALVMPSLYEGFGFPPLEAMAAGCATIVSRCASLPEVCGDSPLYFDARDAGELAAAMLAVSRDSELRRRLIERGRRHARRYTWDASATASLAVLDRALGNGLPSAASLPAKA